MQEAVWFRGLFPGMNVLCNDVCRRYKANHSNNSGSPYEKGLSRCCVCRCYFEPGSLFISPGKKKLCPCCKTPVRSKAKWKPKTVAVCNYR